MASAKQHVLSLYRRIFRLAKSWQAMSGDVAETNIERKYIISEARSLFRKNKEVTNNDEIKEFIREAEARIELALHYKNPFPRPMNIPQSTLPFTGHAMTKSQKTAMKRAKPIYLKSYNDADR
ncbi:LYR motif-containing protein 1-like [Gigantopelta aegis]|uniref:LYR motif-containing protein 1-like n=1 Tax=Gigantopelta aegis TaxID=1735272 RepID=UPI001B88C9B0|nr:LYR motif-containing protein 1-like [Gigantopelta aegis]XP_041363498.1 LYR motif-containing protein 1-like [Gigantopelta aegis]